MALQSVYPLLILAFGFSVSGMLGTLYQLVTDQPPSFQILTGRVESSILLALPFLMLTAPFIIMRNTIKGIGIDNSSFGFAMLATMVAGFWSLMSGTLMVWAIETIGLLAI